jgi:hypothetical protein
MLSACATSTNSPRPLPIAQCGTEALEYCDPPHPGRSDQLGATELEDDHNRSAWLICIERHRAAAACLRQLQAAGVLRPAEPDPAAPAGD